MSGPLIRIRDLTVAFGAARVLRGVSLDLERGAITGVVGESGSGKTTLASAIPRLLPDGAALGGRIEFGGLDLATMPEAEMRRLRGTRIALIAQDPMTALNPVFRIGTQLVDLQRARHPKAPAGELRDRAVRMLGRVGIPDAARRIDDYPHRFSGGMRQRIMIAAALLAEPELLIADEPTSALDPTVEAQIAALFEELRRDFQGSVLLVSHSLGLVGQLCDTVAVLYAGTVVESGPAAEVLRRPRHPYTRALVACEIGPGARDGAAAGGAAAGGTAAGGAERVRLASIPGEVPDPARPPPGCPFEKRCPRAAAVCRTTVPPPRAVGPGHAAACLFA